MADLRSSLDAIVSLLSSHPLDYHLLTDYEQSCYATTDWMRSQSQILRDEADRIDALNSAKYKLSKLLEEARIALSADNPDRKDGIA